MSDNEKYDAEHLTKKGEIRAKVDSKTRSVVAKHQSQIPILMDYHKRLLHVQAAKACKKGSGIRYFINPRTLFDRLELVGGSIMAGNDSAKNEFSEVAHVLWRLGLIKDDALKDLLQGFMFRLTLFPLVRGEIFGTRVLAWRGGLSSRGVCLWHGVVTSSGWRGTGADHGGGER